MNGKIDKDDEAKKLKAFISQPVEGLLYDLDLMSEQCRTEINVLRSEAVKYLREEIERLRIELLIAKNVCQSRAEARRIIKQGAFEHMMQQVLKEGDNGSKN